MRWRLTVAAMRLVVVGHLERPEAVVADVQGLGGELAAALPTAQPGHVVHVVLLIGRALAPGHGPRRLAPIRRRIALVAAASQGPSLSRSG